MSGAIHSRHNVEVSAATDHQAIFIRWAWDSGGDFHELPAGGRAPIHVVADDRDSRTGRGRLPRERNAVRRGFVTAREGYAKQGAYCQQEAEWVGSHWLHIVDCLSFGRLSTIAGFCTGEPVRTSWELGHTEADTQGCIFVQLSQKVSS